MSQTGRERRLSGLSSLRCRRRQNASQAGVTEVGAHIPSSTHDTLATEDAIGDEYCVEAVWEVWIAIVRLCSVCPRSVVIPLVRVLARKPHLDASVV